MTEKCLSPHYYMLYCKPVWYFLAKDPDHHIHNAGQELALSVFLSMVLELI